MTIDLASIFGRGGPKEGDRVENTPFNITTGTGIASVMVILGGAIPAVIKATGAITLSDAKLVGAFGLIGAGVIALAIAVGADSIARAYASAWVIPRSKDEETGKEVPAKPAMQAVAEALKPQAAKSPANAPFVVPALSRFVFKTHGEEEVVLAIKVEDDKDEIKYLVARPGQEPVWVRGDEVTLVAG